MNERMKKEEFNSLVMELGKCTTPEILEIAKQIDNVLKDVEGKGLFERFNTPQTDDEEAVLNQNIHFAEEVTDKQKYRKLRYRTIEQIGFYIRPARVWFFPCKQDQQKLKRILANATWILGNKEYEPPIELNNTKDEINDSSWETVEERKATKEEMDRIGIGGWHNIPDSQVQTTE